MQEIVPNVLGTLVTDVFGSLAWQAGGMAGAGLAAVAQRILRRRSEQARDILIEELRSGEKTLAAPEVDEAVAVCSGTIVLPKKALRGSICA